MQMDDNRTMMFLAELAIILPQCLSHTQSFEHQQDSNDDLQD